MNSKILNTDIQNFIEKNWNTDILSLLLKKPIFPGVSQKELVEQLEAKKKCEKKLPTWFGSPKIYYPKKRNIEQSSSEKTAAYKSQIASGKSLLDLTGGFGVDSYFFSKEVDTVFYTEINRELSKIADHNFNILKAKNIEVISGDGIVFLENSKKSFDCIYLDPSRRNDLKGRVFRLADCKPDILRLLDLLFDKSGTIMIKTSPLLDISEGLKELPGTKEIHVVSVDNEVKELLWVLKSGHEEPPLIKTINIKSRGNEYFEFIHEGEQGATSIFGQPQKYLYEPNAAIMKSGAFKLVGERFSLKKLHEHSHLYTSDCLISFPGRIFEVEKVVGYGKKEIRSLGISKCNITTRNFPETVASIRKKFKLKSGGDIYLFFTKNVDSKLIVLICRRPMKSTQDEFKPH